MAVVQKHIYINLVTAVVVTLFFVGCTGKGEAVQRMNRKLEGPASVGTGINGKYTDSGKVTAHFITPLRKDFSNDHFPYEEFPEGIDLTFYEEGGKESHITATYAMRYTQTGLVDLRGDVKLLTSDSVTLLAEQLYWDQNHSWIFTDQPYTLITKDGSRNTGDLFDSNEDFTNFVSLNNIGKQYLKEENTANDTLQ